MADQNATLGKTRWRRFAVTFVPAFAVAAGTLFLIGTGAIAAGFQISGIPFVLHADQLAGQDFVQYAEPDTVGLPGGLPGTWIDGSVANGQTAETKAGTTWYAADTVTTFSSATIDGLVQTVCAKVPLFSGLAHKDILVVTEGTASAPAGLTAWAPSLTADSANFTNMNVGEFSQSAGFIQHAATATIKNVSQIGLGTYASNFNLSGLKLYASFVDLGTTANGFACPS